MATLDLPNGYYELPAGKLANVVTCLEMKTNPQFAAKPLPAGYSLRVIDPGDLEGYRRLFRKVGGDLLWFWRLIMPEEKVRGIHGQREVRTLGH